MASLALLFGYNQYPNGELMTQSAARCDRAIDAYRAGQIEKIFITCNVTTNGIQMSDKMAEYMTKHGVRETDIVMLPVASNTAGEIDALMIFAKPERQDRVVGISSYYHLPRIKYLFWTRGIRAEVFGTWGGTSWKDLWIEPVKMINSFFRPFSSSKVL